MQTYFFDIQWNGEILLDDEGMVHFDEGSALYYARMLARRVSRGGGGDLVQVHVRQNRGQLLATMTANPHDPHIRTLAQRRAIVERDLARQMSVAA